MKIGIVLLAAVWLMLIAASWAEAGAVAAPNSGTSGSASESTANSGDEYNFNWLDPDKKISVLQNRKYLKANHLVLSAMVGPGMTNAYRTTYAIQPRVAYYISEMFGIEMFYTQVVNQENATFQALKIAGPNVLPMVREVRSEYGALLHYVPWYAKINVFNKILYFDWYFSGGAGTMNSAVDTSKTTDATQNYVLQNNLGLFYGTGLQFHLSQSFLVRLDVTGSSYRVPLMGTSGDNTWFSTFLFGLGVGYRL